jgi:hypothetical protein
MPTERLGTDQEHPFNFCEQSGRLVLRTRLPFAGFAAAEDERSVRA